MSIRRHQGGDEEGTQYKQTRFTDRSARWVGRVGEPTFTSVSSNTSRTLYKGVGTASETGPVNNARGDAYNADGGFLKTAASGQD